MPSQQTNEKYTAHILECASIAQQVAQLIGLRDDSARQACFATVCIDAKGHGVFLEPVPPDTKTPTNGAPKKTEQEIQDAFDRAAAKKADAQIADVPRQTSAEDDAGTRRTLLLQTVQSGVDLLNKEGHKPPITPKGLCAVIKKEFPGKDNLGSLDLDELESLVKKLSDRLDKLRAEKPTTDDDIGF